VRADDAFGVVDPEVSRYARSDVAAVGAVALVTQAVHELYPGFRRAGQLPSGFLERAGEPEPGQRRSDHVESVGRVAVMGPRIGQRGDQVHDLGDRARVAVGDDEWQSVRLGRSDVEEVDRLSVDLGRELGEPVELGLLRSPVVAGSPIRDQLLQVADRHAGGPVDAGELDGPPGPVEPVLQVVEVGLGNLDPEGPDVVLGAVRVGHRAPLSSTRVGPRDARQLARFRP
jgi:hypothetical protein